MGKNGKNFLDQLRAADERTKRKVMIIISCICMIVIIYVWLGYFNNLVSSTARPVFADIQNASTTQATSSGFWENTKSNADTLYKKISGAFGNIFQGSKQYNVSPSQ
jgi:hypothetical protein